MSTPRDRPAAVALDGKVYVVGGTDASGVLASMEVYDPATNTWSAKASMPSAKGSPGAAVANGRIYVFGGDTQVYEYDPATNSWATKAPLPVTPGGVAVAAISGNIYVAFNTAANTRPKLYRYDPFQNIWEQRQEHPDVRTIVSLGISNGMIYAVGGWFPNQTPAEPTRVDRYDPSNDQWTTNAIPPLTVRRTHLGATLPTVDGKMYVIGGWDGYSALTSVEVYDPWTNSWSSETALPSARYAMAYASVGYRIYALGGSTGSPLTTNQQLALPEPAQPQNPIVFVTDYDGTYEFHTINPDGTKRLRITNDSYAEWVPSWSPDGTKIVGAVARGQDFDVYTINADGSDWRRVTTDSRNEFKPTWSPDGREIAFLREESADVQHVWIASASGGSERRLTSGAGTEEERPAWSPDGQKIAFTSNREGTWQIYVANAADGTNVTRLTNLSGGAHAPAWSPDGRRIAFFSEDHIYAMNPNGSNIQQLTSTGAPNLTPQWSPDGTRIVFFSTRSGYAQVYVMNADGSNQQNISNNSASEWSPAWAGLLAGGQLGGNPLAFVSDRDGNEEIYVLTPGSSIAVNVSQHSGVDGHPDWSPDGQNLVFHSSRDGECCEIYTMKADGSNIRRLTNSSGWDGQPVWSPDGRTIAFESLRTGIYEVYIMN